MADDFTCAPAPAPVFSLAYGSRYADGSNSSTLDAEADAEVDEALDPIDDFLRDLTSDANLVLAPDTDRRLVADCVISRIAVWAKDDAMGDLRSTTSNLTIGSRLAAFGLAVLQVAPFTTQHRDLEVVRTWLKARQRAQMVFWEEGASDGAGQGNLRAWAALAGAAVGELTQDRIMLGWSAWSAAYVMCKAETDGSLPQEMGRGRFALHYQLHSIAPLVVTVAQLKRQGFDLTDECGGALRRIVNFAVSDLERGEKTLAITGEVQTFFDGSDKLEAFNLAWIEAYLTLVNDPALDRFAEEWRPLSHSKLGGDQTAIWGPLR